MALVYVVEDDKNIAEIESFSLKNSGYDVHDFECAKDFYAAIEKIMPDLILLDIMLPDEDGLTIVQNLRKNKATCLVPIILVTAKTTELDKVKGLNMGADDYMTKPFGVMELISRVKALLRRSSSGREEKILQFADIAMDSEKREVTVSGENCDLTFKEYELLKLLLLHTGIVVTRDTILDRVWGTDYEGESRTLDMHIKTLRQKLKTAGSYIKTVRNVGYILDQS